MNLGKTMETCKDQSPISLMLDLGVIESTIGYKVFEVRDGLPLTLFHGYGGTRRLPLDTWLRAEERFVVDGSGVSPYLSGWHVLKSYDAAVKFCKIYKNNRDGRFLCAVHIGLTRNKHDGREEPTLAKYIKITSEDWANRKSLQEILGA